VGFEPVWVQTEDSESLLALVAQIGYIRICPYLEIVWMSMPQVEFMPDKA
jgi:hypothetical protein